MKAKRGGEMSMSFKESFTLEDIKKYTKETVDDLDSINAKMDRQIALLEHMVEALERIKRIM